MALQSAIEPSENNEPLANEPITDAEGRVRPWFRNWWERRRLQLGEILSGVNRNAANIVQLETDYQAADGTVTSAYIAADAVVASDAESANATLQTTIEAAYQAADTTLQANIDSEATARASGDTAIASDVTTLTARVGGVEGVLVKNAYFQEEFSGTAIPPEWSDWNNGAGTWSARTVGEGYGFALSAAASAEVGISQDIDVSAGKKYLVSAEVRRTLGFLTGAGVLLTWRDSGGSTLSTSSIVFATEENTDGNATGSPDGPTRWEKEVTAPTSAASVRLYAMNHYASFGAITGANGIFWRECSLKPLTNAQAQVTVQATAIADIEGNIGVSYGVVLDGNGHISSLRGLNDGSSSSWTFVASTFQIFDGTSDIAPFSVSGGVVSMQDVEINGSLVINGTVNTDQLASNSVTNTEVDQTAAATSPSNTTWTDVASFSFTSVGIGVQLRGSCDVNIFSDGTSPLAQFRLVRDSTTLKTSQVFSAVDAGSGFQKVEQSIVLDYNDLPSSGTYTYKLQAYLNEGTSAVVVSTFDVSNRFLSATEFKR